MTEREALKLVSVAIANFPAMQEKDMRPTAALWFKMLEDIPYRLAEKALLKVLSLAKFFPTVAEIREAVVYLRNPDQITSAEAWGLVVAAIRRYSGIYNPDKVYAALPDTVARVAKMMDIREIGLSENQDVTRAQFMRMYDTVAARERERAQLPANVLQITDALKRKMLVCGE